MSTYAGVTFEILADDGVWRRGWEQEEQISVRHIPYANRDDVQSGGRGNLQVTVPAYLTDTMDVATLRSAVGQTPRYLTDLYGYGYSNVYLIKMRDIKRWIYGERWVCELTFMREGT